MPYIPGQGWTSIVTGQVEAVVMDDQAMSGVYAATPGQQIAYQGGYSPILAGAGIIGPVTPPQPVQPPPIIPAIAPAAAAAGIVLPAWLLAILGIAGAGYAGYQALGGGEGGGLFGLNVLGGDEFQMGGVEFGGPGLPGPTDPYTGGQVPIKGGRLQYYYMKRYTSAGNYRGMKIAMYNTVTKKWKVWNLPKPSLAVIGKNYPRHQMLTRLRRNLKRHTADAKTLLRIAQPSALESTRKAGGKWTRGKRRWID